MKKLGKLRKEIDIIDNNIVSLLAKRSGVSLLIQKQKEVEGLPETDAGREKKVVENWKKQASKKNLDEIEIEKIAMEVISMSKKKGNKENFSMQRRWN